MEFLSEKLGHADGLSRLIPKFSESLEDRMIVALRDEKELSVLLYNMIKESRVTLEDIKKQLRKTNSLKKIKKQVWLIERQKKGSSVWTYSICEQILLYTDIVVMPYTLQKKILREFLMGHPSMTRMKSLTRCGTYLSRMDQYIEKKNVEVVNLRQKHHQ